MDSRLNTVKDIRITGDCVKGDIMKYRLITYVGYLIIFVFCYYYFISNGSIIRESSR